MSLISLPIKFIKLMHKIDEHYDFCVFKIYILALKRGSDTDHWFCKYTFK